MFARLWQNLLARSKWQQQRVPDESGYGPDQKKQILLALAALALAVRLLVPAGWMPAFNTGHPTIIVCTGAGMAEAWVDADGKIHKASPESGGKGFFPCVFDCLSLALGAFALGLFLAAALDHARTRLFAHYVIGIGRGLVAPPPPARGPPLLN